MLTKDAKFMLYELYKEYQARRNVRVSRSESKYFKSAESVQENFFPDWSLEDVEDTMRELSRNNFLNNVYADGTIYDCELSDYAISVMESQKKETFLSVADFISKFIP